MVGRPGVEPESVEPQSTVLPLDDQPHTWRRRWDSNPRANLLTYRFSRANPSAAWVLLHMAPPQGIEPRSRD